MQKVLLTSLLLVVMINNLLANTFTFNGTGNWNDATKWTPVMPVYNPSVNFYQGDTIIINGSCTVVATDNLTMNQDITYFINGNILNNGNLNIMGRVNITSMGSIINNNHFALSSSPWFGDGYSNNVLTNLGTITNNATMELNFRNPNFINGGTVTNNSNLTIVGNIVNNNLVENHGWFQTLSDFEYFDFNSQMIVLGFINADIINNGPLTNSGVINSDSKIENHSKIISNGGSMSSTGRQFFNYDTIIGNMHTFALANYGVLSPGLLEFDTDTMFFGGYGLANVGSILMDVNNANDYDVIVLDYGQSISATLSNMTLTFNPNFTPSITDTFQLVKVLNVGPSPFKPSRNSVTLPTPPTGLAWVLLEEPTGVRLALQNSIPLPFENLTFVATQKLNTVQLNWAVTKIENVSTFEIERADANNSFSSIGKVNGSEKLNYSFIDSKPNIGVNSYRLKVIDIDGNYKYSNTININYSVIENEIINTIVENELHININADESVVIFNEAGQTVYNQLIKEGQTTISLSHLPTGMYFVQTANANYKILKL